MTPKDLEALLREVWKNSRADFSGIGLIVCSDERSLPIIGLRDFEPEMRASVAETLTDISRSTSKFHDGFHLLDEHGKLLRVSQYLAAPVIDAIRFDKGRMVGSRFVTALFGSALPGVLMTGIASATSGISIFQDGVEVILEESP